ncbi:MAG: SDR family NAD(P)-dependent oxidoreductase [Bacteroidetes bacterium]|nr:SDR family NAD(P)-dependent oxidoreductase [Bacteroidota bacterium]
MKKILIFGATSGIGKMLAEKFVSEGAYVIATGRRFPLLEALRETAQDKIEIYQNDVVQIEETEKLFHQLIAKHGTLDTVVHCSGIGAENHKLDWSVEAETLKTNVWAATHIYGLVFKQFQKQQSGHLVAISSIASLRGNRHAPAYFASKAFQVNYLESLYFKTKEIKSGKVYVTDIRPGFVDTKMALGNEIFWLTPLPKAVRQIYSAIAHKKRKVYISHRWALVAFVLKIVPSQLIKWVK